MHRFRPRLTYANVVATLALFVALGGGAYAAATVGPDNIKNDAVRSRHIKDGGVKNADLGANSVGPGKVIDRSLTGGDIKPNSGVNRCPGEGTLTVRLGAICAGSDGVTRTWSDALDYCAGLGLRLPTNSEATTLGNNFDIPNIAAGEFFWADGYFVASGNAFSMLGTEGPTNVSYVQVTAKRGSVCVATPTN